MSGRLGARMVRGRRPAAVLARAGFTLIELLVVIAIAALLIGLILPALGAAREQARMVRELSACKSLMIAYHRYAYDHKQQLLPGYMTGPACDDKGNVLGNPENKRYPWKLAPYFNYQLTDCILVNARREEIDQMIAAGFSYSYAVSVMPSFGLNTQYVGGNELFSWLPFVRTLDDPFQPSNLIVFASARSNPGGPGTEVVSGYYEVRPPVVDRYREGEDAFRFGFVHPRYGNSAVAGFFDGHAGMLVEDDLLDMRRWCDAAARANDPDWTYTP